MEQYIQWLVTVYQDKFGFLPEEVDVVAESVRVLRWHLGRLPGEEEFVSLVAVEVADRIRDADPSTREPFLRLFARSADTVRHRIARAARRWHTNRADSNLEQLPTPAPAQEGVIDQIKSELLEALTDEERLIAEQMLSGIHAPKLAEQLGVSPRTLYRKLAAIRDRLRQ